MKEAFIHHIWQKKCIDFDGLKTFHGSSVEIINFGQLNSNSGPDFSQAELVIGQQLWVGNVEMHVNSSDWDLHKHSDDLAYQNVILHVVWNHDKEIDFLRSRNIETLVISDYVKKEIVYNYQQILNYQSDFLACRPFVKTINWEKISLWFERLMIDRLEEKAKGILTIYQETNHNWEETTFRLIASNFGLKINQEAFEIWSKSFPFSVLQKNQTSKKKIEALFFGQAGFLENSLDDYSRDLEKEYNFLRLKYNLTHISSSVFKFSSLRPHGFPTIRLAQLATLYTSSFHLFSDIIGFQSRKEIENYFKNMTISEYWIHHYVFGKESKPVNKSLSVDKIHNLIINTILPLKFAYELTNDKVETEFYSSILEELKPEKNAIIDEFLSARFPIPNAKNSQVILHLKKWYCDEKKCLNCAIGTEVLKE